MRATTHCVECGKPGVSAYQMRKATPDQRAELRADGICRIEARGLCQPCYRAARESGRLADYERRNRDRLDILEDWNLLANPNRHLAHEIMRLAPQFDMTEKALSRALHRAGVRSRFESGHGERFKGAA